MIKEICKIDCKEEFNVCGKHSLATVVKKNKDLVLYCSIDCPKNLDSKLTKSCCYLRKSNICNICMNKMGIDINISFKFLMAWEVLKKKIQAGKLTS